jgi:hypothetical protein
MDAIIPIATVIAFICLIRGAYANICDVLDLPRRYMEWRRRSQPYNAQEHALSIAIISLREEPQEWRLWKQRGDWSITGIAVERGGTTIYRADHGPQWYPNRSKKSHFQGPTIETESLPATRLTDVRPELVRELNAVVEEIRLYRAVHGLLDGSFKDTKEEALIAQMG